MLLKSLQDFNKQEGALVLLRKTTSMLLKSLQDFNKQVLRLVKTEGFKSIGYVYFLLKVSTKFYIVEDLKGRFSRES